MPNNEELMKLLETAMVSSDKRKPLKGAAKWITLTILCLTFGTGVFGSFEMAHFDLSDSVMFLEAFAWFFGPLVLSVGLGSSVKKVTEVIASKKTEKEELSEPSEEGV